MAHSMKCIIIFIISFVIITIDAHAVSENAKIKYPYTLITSDYGILNENDLGAFAWGGTAKPFSAEASRGEYNIWQCFPREQVMITLSDMGHSSDELGWKKNVASLEIYVLTNNDLRDHENIKHTYEMRAHWTITGYQKRFNKWLKLMDGEKYVCLAGHFVDLEKEVRNGKTWITYGWIFEKIKTKKGCDSYFDSCTPTYEKYLIEKEETKKLLSKARA